MIKQKHKIIAFIITTLCLSAFSADAKTGNLQKQIQILEDRVSLKELVDVFSNLADQKKTQEQTLLFTEDAKVDSYLDGKLISSVKGRKEIGDTFAEYLKLFDTVYHINGQLVLNLDGDSANGVSYCDVTLIGIENTKRIKTHMGVRYHDKYVRRNGKWLISERASYFTFQEKSEFK